MTTLRLPESVKTNLSLPLGLDPTFWKGCFNARESSMQQLAPYVGKMKSGMARQLIQEFSRAGETVLDPFAGSGVVPYEALVLGRHAIGNDLSPYAYVLTRGKLEAPPTYEQALKTAAQLLDEIEVRQAEQDVSSVPEWVRQFFHERTLRETLAACQLFLAQQQYFLLACLMGILHHVRPGFLSFPASHLTPYLRIKKYPPDHFPKMYEYRDLRSRLLAKVERAYRRSPRISPSLGHLVLQENAMSLSLGAGTVDAIVSSPPYLGALDYARDNRLRLWFLGVEDYRRLEHKLTANDRVYTRQMSICLTEMYRVLRPGGYCALVLGDVNRNGQHRDTAFLIAELSRSAPRASRFEVERLLDDPIPDERRSRRRTRTTKVERILVMRRP